MRGRWEVKKQDILGCSGNGITRIAGAQDWNGYVQSYLHDVRWLDERRPVVHR